MPRHGTGPPPNLLGTVLVMALSVSPRMFTSRGVGRVESWNRYIILDDTFPSAINIIRL